MHILNLNRASGHTLMSWCDRDLPTLARPASSDQRGAQIDARVWVKPSATRACRWLPRCASPPPQWPRISRGVSWGMSTVCAWRAASCSALLPLSSAPPLARCSCSRLCSALSWLACSAFSLWASARCSCSRVKVRVRLRVRLRIRARARVGARCAPAAAPRGRCSPAAAAAAAPGARAAGRPSRRGRSGSAAARAPPAQG